MYYTIKNLHVAFVVLSISGFLLRGVWMLTGNSLLQHRITRALPHVIDTLLLVTALVAAAMIAQYPFVAGWVTAKVLGLLAYIVLGTIALKRGRTITVRVLALLGALATYAWIASVAMTKNPAGFLPL
ncbi:MAG TPA: SirB2 family protein [Rhodocyclaceae bacterium]|nr:SirB2 family protein [Rhodocyclaceae bacterium]HRQ48419.1 SirB2 family protein [Rhodocyclaceae bacterium]